MFFDCLVYCSIVSTCSLATFLQKKDDVREGMKKLHNSYSLPNIKRLMKSKRIRWARHVACMGNIKNGREALIGKSKGNKPLGRSKHA
jgi:hypothetical protein